MKTTVSVICYKSKILRDGASPLMLRICKDRKRRYQSLGVSVKPLHWDFKKNEPTADCPNRDKIMLLVKKKINEFERFIINLEIEGKEITATSIVKSNGVNKPKVTKSVGDVYREYILSLKDEKRSRYAGMYEVSLSSFVKFNKHMDIPFSEIDTAWLKRYETWMKKQGYAINTIGTRLRHLRVIFNQAIEQRLIKDDCYPFHSYKVAKMNQQTAKRALTKNEIKAIINFKGSSYMESLAIDLFTFSYLTAGINFIDIAKLRKENIVDSKVVYIRNKTSKQIMIPLQEQTLKLVAKYHDASSPFLFPILSPFHKTDVQIANRLHKVLAKINKHLKEIGKKLKLPIPLTTYVARHSFATVLKRAGVATSIISESLGHSSEHITQVYLDSFDNEQIDEAMKNLL